MALGWKGRCCEGSSNAQRGGGEILKDGYSKTMNLPSGTYLKKRKE